MTSGKHIVLLDPGLLNSKGIRSDNLGDCIISEACISGLHEMFPGRDIIRISTHSFFSCSDRRIINSAELCFVGGTNLLHSDMLGPRIFMMRKGKLLWLFPGFKNLILMGVGWGHDFSEKTTLRTKILYKKILHPGFIHSVRDTGTLHKLISATGRDVLNTACPTMWKLEGVDNSINKLLPECLFTLTDYNQDRSNDEALILLLLEHFSSLVFFPQGSDDILYISSLDVYLKNKTRIKLLPHSYETFKDFLKNEEFVYIGTRLHAGIKCLEKSKKSLIISVDHRARTIANDTFLPVVERSDREAIKKWLSGKNPVNDRIQIPLNAIEKWKSQFK